MIIFIIIRHDLLCDRKDCQGGGVYTGGVLGVFSGGHVGSKKLLMLNEVKSRDNASGCDEAARRCRWVRGD